MRKNNQLTHPQMFRLGQWVQTHAEEIRNMTFIQIAEKATTAMGFSVTEGNATSACRMAEVKTKKSTNRAILNGGTAYRRLQHLEDAVSRIFDVLQLPYTPFIDTREKPHTEG